MTEFEKNLSGEAARAKVREQRQAASEKKRRVAPRALDLVQITGSLPNFPGSQENLLPLALLSGDLPAVIPTLWPGSLSGQPGSAGRIEVVEFFLNNDYANPIFEQEYTLPFAANDFPLTIPVPSDEFQSESRYSLSYRAYNANGTPETSDVTVFTVDKTAPDEGRHPESLPFPVTTITQAYLDNNGGVVSITVPNYLGTRAEDKVFGYVSSTPGDPPKLSFVTEDEQPQTGVRPLVLTFAEADLIDFPDGRLYFTYMLVDRAGNESPFASPAVIDLALLPEPINLNTPVIPLASEVPPVIDRADAELGVTVEEIFYDNWLPRDSVHVYWGGRLIQVIPIEASTVFPLTQPISWDQLRLGGYEPRDVDVYYKVVRGSLEWSSATVTIQVDLRAPGPTNPDPGPENPLLPPPQVLSDNLGATPNRILVADKRYDAKATFNLWDNPALGEVIRLFWDGTPVPLATHTIDGTEAPNEEIVFNIPWSLIENTPDTAALPVYYQVTLVGLPVPSNSITQPVEVNLFELGALTPPTYPDINRFGSIACGERVWEGVRVRVAGDPSNFAVGDTVTVEWAGFSGTGAPVAGTTGSEPKVLAGSQPADGFDIVIPFRPYIFEIGLELSGYLQARIAVAKADGGGNGESDWVNVYIGITTPGGCQCVGAGVCPI